MGAAKQAPGVAIMFFTFLIMFVEPSVCSSAMAKEPFVVSISASPVGATNRSSHSTRRFHCVSLKDAALPHEVVALNDVVRVCVCD